MDLNGIGATLRLHYPDNDWLHTNISCFLPDILHKIRFHVRSTGARAIHKRQQEYHFYYFHVTPFTSRLGLLRANLNRIGNAIIRLKISEYYDLDTNVVHFQ